METINKRKPRIHHGEAVRKLREILNMKQSVLGDKINKSQQTISQLESKEIIEDSLLSKLADALSILVELIKNYDHDRALEVIINNNTFENSEYVSQGVGIENHYSIKEVKDIFQSLLDEKDKRISEKDQYIADLQRLLKNIKGEEHKDF